ncbi:hypothetical protein NHP21005_09820 [Helicobacter sp. NHP21005]|nr:hypothetical protein NHP21005_09820 [Helicobacter sp. NHP21005]
MGSATNETESERCEKCLAYEKFFGENSRKDLRNRYEIYPDLEADLEDITNHFLELVDFFNEIPQEYFKPMDNLPTPQQTTHTQEPVQEEKHMETSAYPLSIILYGPPGTGKTYNTIDKALEILGIDTTKIDRTEAKILFDHYKEKKQIDFVTFHQSYGYEEFVEGIRPEMNEDSDQLHYKIEAGIFKEICKRAERALKQPNSPTAQEQEIAQVDSHYWDALLEAFVAYLEQEQETNGRCYVQLHQGGQKELTWSKMGKGFKFDIIYNQEKSPFSIGASELKRTIPRGQNKKYSKTPRLTNT